MDSRSGQGVWREGYERSFTAMDLCIMNANELASAAVTWSDSWLWRDAMIESCWLGTRGFLEERCTVGFCLPRVKVLFSEGILQRMSLRSQHTWCLNALSKVTSSCCLETTNALPLQRVSEWSSYLSSDSTSTSTHDKNNEFLFAWEIAPPCHTISLASLTSEKRENDSGVSCCVFYSGFLVIVIVM